MVGSKKRARGTRRRPNLTALLTDDLLDEILASVPYRSLCRFRCVCKRWSALIAHPDHRARLPQTLAERLQSDFDDEDDDGDGYVLGFKIYSSATGVWIHKQSGWIIQILLQMDFKSVFLDGVLYVIASQCVIGAFDVEGEIWRIFEFPRSKDSPFYDTAAGFIDQSQGRLHLANVDDMVGDKLAIYELDDKNSEEWTLKHTVRFKHLVGTKNVDFGFHEFIVVAIHPDRNMVSFVFFILKEH